MTPSTQRRVLQTVFFISMNEHVDHCKKTKQYNIMEREVCGFIPGKTLVWSFACNSSKV